MTDGKHFLMVRPSSRIDECCVQCNKLTDFKVVVAIFDNTPVTPPPPDIIHTNDFAGLVLIYRS